ncbi:hypothetical protein Q7P37_000064 [Cladosporium fusiforme]
MAARMALQTIHGLFGRDGPSTPIFGDNTLLTLLARDVAAGLSISNTTSAIGDPESSHAVATATTRLQLTGRIPMDLHTMQSLSDQQRKALGFEPMNLEPEIEMQTFGAPPFKELDFARFLAALRFSARCQQLQSGFKPIFEVGIVTMTVNGLEQGFFAQSLQAEVGVVTDTIWLYRWVIMDPDGGYEEHWRPFDGPIVQQFAPVGDIVPPLSQQQQQFRPLQQSFQDLPAAQVPNPPHQPQPTETPQPQPRRHRHLPYETFNHAHLSDAELFQSAPELIQGEAIMRLAESYSNGEIFANLQAAHPGKIKNVNVITKRLTHAIAIAAQAEGVVPAVVRARIREAKEANGVVHKAKLDVTPYG